MAGTVLAVHALLLPVSPYFDMFMVVLLISLVAIEAELGLGSKSPSPAAQFSCSTLGLVNFNYDLIWVMLISIYSM